MPLRSRSPRSRRCELLQASFAMKPEVDGCVGSIVPAIGRAASTPGLLPAASFIRLLRAVVTLRLRVALGPPISEAPKAARRRSADGGDLRSGPVLASKGVLEARRASQPLAKRAFRGSPRLAVSGR